MIAARQAFVDLVGGELAAAFAAITRTERAATVRYAVRGGAATEPEILAALRAARVKDLATHATQVGPHRDDLVFELDGREAGSYASQGQLRAIMLAWKTGVGQRHRPTTRAGLTPCGAPAACGSGPRSLPAHA